MHYKLYYIPFTNCTILSNTMPKYSIMARSAQPVLSTSCFETPEELNHSIV